MGEERAVTEIRHVCHWAWGGEGGYQGGGVGEPRTGSSVSMPFKNEGS